MRNLFTTTHRENPTLTPSAVLRTGPTLSLRARETDKEKSFFPVMLSLSKHLMILCSILIFTACDKLPKTLTDPTTTVAFSGSNPGSNSVYMAQNTSLSSGDILAIDVKANNISSNVYGAAFDVDFDSSEMTYSSYVKGDFLGSVEPNVELQSGSSNKVVVGVSKQGTATGATGSGTIVTLKFNVTGGSTVSFINNELRNSSNQAISGISWYGGAVAVQ